MDFTDFESFAATKDDELHPDLLPWVEQDGLFGPMLRHPLVYSVPLFHNGMANAQYAAKTERLNRAEAEADWHSYVFLHERPHRFTALQEVQAFTDEVPGDLIRSVWMDSENVWQHQEEWVELFSEAPTGLMDEDEALALSQLPETLTIYRGAQADLNEDGLSWTLSMDRASWFATRFNPDEPVLIQAEVNKSDVIALLLGRGEEEVLAFPENLTNLTYLELNS